MGAFDVAVTATLVVVVHFMHQGVCGAYEKDNNKCDIFQGKWVYDPKYPLYSAKNCPFIEQEFDCQENGRPDKLYLKYRWKPNSCKLPRFRGGVFLERFRGKRIMFVGDSISLNQWQSLTCMLYLAVPKAKYTLIRTGGLSTFSFPAYNVSLLFSRNAFLVDIVGEKIGRVLKLNSISSGDIWKSADVLIFDSWHWWLHRGRKQPWDIIQDMNYTYQDMDRLVAFNKALNTWAKWVKSSVDTSKTKVFFRGISPDHTNSSDWGDGNAKNCRGETQPVMGHNDHYPGGTHPAEAIVEDVIRKISKKVKLLKVTALSQLRKDGHPSVYGYGGARATDCSHWCLPGVPDTWNQLLYALLIPNSN